MIPPISTGLLLRRTWLLLAPAVLAVAVAVYRGAAPVRLYVASALLYIAGMMALSMLQSLYRRIPTAFSERTWRVSALGMAAAACLIQGVVAAVFVNMPGAEPRMLVLFVLCFLVTLTPSRGRGADFWLSVPALLGPTVLLALWPGGQMTLSFTEMGALVAPFALYKFAAHPAREPIPHAVEEVVMASRKEKPTYLTRLSHELRTPLAGIMGTTELLEREELTEQQYQLVRTVKLSAEELFGVVSSILNGGKPPSPSEVSRMPVPPGSISSDDRGDALDTVLVVDDSDLNIEVLREQLKTLGMAVDTASDGLQGLSKWRRRRYAMVIADIQMPRMDGLEMARRIRNEEARDGNRHHTPIVGLSANAQRGGDAEALEAGFDGYLTKPLMLRRLQETLKQWVDKDAAESASSRSDVAGSPIDREALMGMVGGNGDVVESVLRRFSVAGASLVEEISGAVNEGDRLRVLAHKLKGTARSVCASRLGDLAEKLETSRSAADITLLEAEWRTVASTLDRWRATVSV